MLRRAPLLAKRLDPLDDEVGLRKNAEVLGQDRLDPVDRRRRVLDVRGTSFVSVRVVVTAIVFLIAELGEEGLQVAREADFLADRFHLTAQARHLFQPDLVNLVSRQGRRGLVGEALAIVRRTVRQRADAGCSFLERCGDLPSARR